MDQISELLRLLGRDLEPLLRVALTGALDPHVTLACHLYGAEHVSTNLVSDLRLSRTKHPVEQTAEQAEEREYGGLGVDGGEHQTSIGRDQLAPSMAIAHVPDPHLEQDRLALLDDQLRHAGRLPSNLPA